MASSWPNGPPPPCPPRAPGGRLAIHIYSSSRPGPQAGQAASPGGVGARRAPQGDLLHVSTLLKHHTPLFPSGWVHDTSGSPVLVALESRCIPCSNTCDHKVRLRTARPLHPCIQHIAHFAQLIRSLHLLLPDFALPRLHLLLIPAA